MGSGRSGHNYYTAAQSVGEYGTAAGIRRSAEKLASGDNRSRRTRYVARFVADLLFLCQSHVY